MNEKLETVKKQFEEAVQGDNNESTAYPYWFIVDPHQTFRCDPHEIAAMIKGPFFSRKSAEDFLKATRYNFGKYACVYCNSGTYSSDYRNLFDGLAGEGAGR